MPKYFEGENFAVLGVISENLTLEIFRHPYNYFGSVCKSAKILFLAILLNLEKSAPRNI